jgi:hypothetical protein
VFHYILKEEKHATKDRQCDRATNSLDVSSFFFNQDNHSSY